MHKTEKETESKLNKLNEHMNKVSDEPVKIKKKSKISRPSFRTAEVVVLVILTAVISLIVGSLITYKIYNKSLNYNKADEELQEFLKIYDEVNSNYYKEVDKKKLIEGAINGMLGTLDENSGYYNETNSNNLSIRLDGKYNGLGIQIYNDDDGDIVILSVFDDSPASKAGLKAGDTLIKYNDKSIKNMDISDFVKMVKEVDGEKFTLTYLRGGKDYSATISKEDITLKSVDSKTYDSDKIGYIYVSVFANNTAKQFKEKLNELEKKDIESLIIDLRSNSGGHLTAAEDMISLFLDKSHPIYQIDNKGEITKYYSNGKTTKKYKIFVLVDGISASASEIMASALKEQYGATLVGQKTYGKGTVQEMQQLTADTYYKYTTKKWLTSKGKQIDKKGLDVDIEVSLEQKYADNPTDENDSQLQKALEEARK